MSRMRVASDFSVGTSRMRRREMPPNPLQSSRSTWLSPAPHQVPQNNNNSRLQSLRRLISSRILPQEMTGGCAPQQTDHKSRHRQALGTEHMSSVSQTADVWEQPPPGPCLCWPIFFRPGWVWLGFVIIYLVRRALSLLPDWFLCHPRTSFHPAEELGSTPDVHSRLNKAQSLGWGWRDSSGVMSPNCPCKELWVQVPSTHVEEDTISVTLARGKLMPSIGLLRNCIHMWKPTLRINLF